MDCLNAEWTAWKKNKDFFILYWCELCKATLAESKQEQNKWMEKNHNTLIHNSIIGRKLISYIIKLEKSLQNILCRCMSICKSLKTPLSLPLWFPLVNHGAVSSYTKQKQKKSTAVTQALSMH